MMIDLLKAHMLKRDQKKLINHKLNRALLNHFRIMMKFPFKANILNKKFLMMIDLLNQGMLIILNHQFKTMLLMMNNWKNIMMISKSIKMTLKKMKNLF
jgi:hypothetical protein